MFIKVFIEKHIKTLLIIFSAVCLIIASSTFYMVSNVMTTSNDECLWVPESVKSDRDSVEIYFDFVKFEGVTWNAGIRDGDQLLSINGVPIRNVNVATVVLNQLASGDSALYMVKRSGEIFEAKVEIKKLINIQFFSISLFSLIWMIVGILVIMAKPFGLTQRLFYSIGVLMVFGSTVILNNVNFFADTLFNNSYVLYFTNILAIIGVSYFSFVYIHFFWLFPRKLKILEYSATTKILYAIPTIFFVILLVLRTWDIERFGVPPYFLIFGGLVVFDLVALGIGFISLFVGYIKLETKFARNSIFVILVSYIIGIISIAYFLIVLSSLPTISIFNSPEIYVPLILVILLPISFGYSIFKYSLLDVSEVFKNTIIYAGATVIIAGTYFLIIYLIGQYVGQAISDEYQGVIAGIIFIGFALLFQSTKDRIQDLLTAKFYPEQFAFQKMLVKFSNEVSTIVGLENILESTKSIFIDNLKINKIGIALKTNDQCVPAFAVGFNKSICQFKSKSTLIEKFVNEKEKLNQPPVIEQNAFDDLFEENSEALKDEGIYTIIPLVIKSKVIGLALFGLKYSGSQFAGKDLELLVAVCNQIAVSIENARLYESENEKLKIDRDLENAYKIQKSLLPKVIPNIKELSISGTMIPAMQVGGDYYDFIQVSERKLFVIIGDVSGKGLSASFYMSKLHTMMKFFCTENSEPKDILTEINKHIYSSIERNWFITVAIGLFDLDRKKIIFSRAGHTPLLVTKKDNTEIYIPKGIGLGLEPGNIFQDSIEQIEIPLAEHQLITFYSDGITEEMNEQGQLFGINKLKDLIENNYDENVNLIKEKIIDELYKYRGNRNQSDDITLVLVKYEL